MSVGEIAAQRSALSSTHLMIMQFDHSNAEMVKFGDTYTDSDYNRAEAERDAADYARRAATKGLPLQYLVVRVQTVAAFGPQLDG